MFLSAGSSDGGVAVNKCNIYLSIEGLYVWTNWVSFRSHPHYTRFNRMNNVNFDVLTETYSMNFYLMVGLCIYTLAVVV